MVAGLALIVALHSETAFAGYGAGGLVLSEAPLRGLGPSDLRAGILPCVGGIGYRVERHDRTGGEGFFCGNRNGSLTFGGIEKGWQGNVVGLIGTAHAGFGAGWLDVGEPDLRYRAAFVYARPTIGVAVPVAFGAVEFDLYAMLPLPLVQSIAGDLLPLVSFPHTGAQISVQFGDFFDRHHRDAEPVAVVQPPTAEENAPSEGARPPMPGSQATNPSPAPPPPPGATEVEGEGDRPLAIPAR